MNQRNRKSDFARVNSLRYFFYICCIIGCLTALSLVSNELFSATIVQAASNKNSQGKGAKDQSQALTDKDKALLDAILGGEVGVVQSSLAGANVNAKDKEGKTFLMFAAEQDHEEIVKELLTAGASVKAKNNAHQTALMFAAGAGLTNNVQRLLDAGAEINAQDKDGKTALMYAATKGLGYTLQAFLARNAKLNIKDKKGKKALSYAIENNNSVAVGLLENYGATK